MEAQNEKVLHKGSAPPPPYLQGMPFVRISASEHYSDEVLTALCDAVYAAILDELGRPGQFRFLELDTFDPAEMRSHRDFIGVADQPEGVFVHVHLNHACTVPERRKFSKAIGSNMSRMAGLRARDYLLLIAERGVRAWTFGDGSAQHVARARNS